MSELALALTLGTANWQLATCNLGLGTWEFGTYFVFCVFLCLCVVVWNGVCARVCVCDVPVCEVRSAKCKEAEVVFCDCDCDCNN